MSLDAYSASAPARVKVLVLPLERVKQSHFAKFVRRLRRENVVRLGDVSPDGRPDRTMFSPLAFPDGLVYYDMSESLPPPSHLELVPFELYRLPLLIVGIVDWKEISQIGGSEEKTGSNGSLGEKLSRNLQYIKENYQSALAHRILVFDCEDTAFGPPAGVAFIPPRAKSRTTTIKTVMCDMTAGLLAEMSVYGKSLQERATIQTPKAAASSIPNGILSSVPSHLAQASRPISMASGSRSSSPAMSPTIDERIGHRMSMPAHIISNPESRNSTPNLRAASPSHGARTPPSKSEEVLPISSTSPPRRASVERTAKSQERSSSAGLGSGSTAERERTKGKARVGVVLGSLYLLAGRWPDAIREFSKSVLISRANSDYVWQAKAMDHLLVTLLMCAWAGMNFKIPDVLQAASGISHTSSTKSSKHSPSNSQHEISLLKEVDDEKRASTLEALARSLADIVYNVLNLYGRAYTFTDDKILSPSYEQSSIRFAKLLTTMNLVNGNLNPEILRHLVAGADLPQRQYAMSERAPTLRKLDIAQMLLRAYPRQSLDTPLSTSDQLSVLAATAGVLMDLEQYRKVAVVLRETMTVVLPPLVQARKDDAAERGIHPAASLGTLNSPVKTVSVGTNAVPLEHSEQGMRTFLSFACRLLGISSSALVAKDVEEQKLLNKNAAEVALHQAIMNAYGAQDLKVDLLWACINICEALPDLMGALRYSARLLRTVSRAIAPAPESTNGAPGLSTEEQERLGNNINRTVSAAQQLGLAEPEADYWDEFLVRDIDLVEDEHSIQLTPHSKAELNTVDNTGESKSKDPFIHNPFLKPKSSAQQPVLVAGERAVFRVMLQNLFEFDLAIDSICLKASEDKVICPAQAVLLGSYRTQTMLLHAIPNNSGNLSVDGCRVKVRGCRQRSFSIFRDPWILPLDAKGKNLRSIHTKTVSAVDSATSKHKSSANQNGPKTTSLLCKVIDGQPRLTVKSISIQVSAIMLLQGETKAFTIFLRNVSSDRPADLVLTSFTDSIALEAQEALASKKMSAFELHELELNLARHPAFRSSHPLRARDLKVGPLADVELEVQAYGKKNFKDGTLQIDYGFLGGINSELQEQFFTRQLKIPIRVTVYPSLLLICSDCFRVNDTLSDKRDMSKMNDNKRGGASPTLNRLSRLGDSASIQCMLLLDFRNAWSSPLTLNLSVSYSQTKSSTSSHTYHYLVQPGQITRIPVSLHRIYLPITKSHAPIPSLNSATKRQFVISSAPTSTAAEIAAREEFWYRESMLSNLSAEWTEQSTGRTGVVDLRENLRLTSTMVAAYRLPDVDISMSVTPCSHEGPEIVEKYSDCVKRTASNTFRVPTSTFLTLRTTFYNRSLSPIHPFLRLQPTLAHQPLPVALDIQSRLLVHGMLQNVRPVLGANEKQVVETNFVVLSAGRYEWNAVIEEVSKPEEPRGQQEKGKGRAATVDLDFVVDDKNRRMWAAEPPCVVDAEDSGEENR